MFLNGWPSSKCEHRLKLGKFANEVSVITRLGVLACSSLPLTAPVLLPPHCRFLPLSVSRAKVIDLYAVIETFVGTSLQTRRFAREGQI
jgi:hypothetical protein